MTLRQKWFFGVSFAYSVILVGCVGALALIPYLASEPFGHGARGCHLTGDQLVFGASCHAFWGATVAEALLSLPLALFLLPLSGLGVISEAADTGDVARFALGAAALFVGASLWAPLAYFFGAVRRLTN